MIDLLSYELDRLARREGKAKMLGRYGGIGGYFSKGARDALIGDKETEQLYKERVAQYSPGYRQQAYSDNKRSFINLARSMVEDKYHTEQDPGYTNSSTDRNFDRLIHDDEDQSHLDGLMSEWEMGDVSHDERSIDLPDNVSDTDISAAIIDRMGEHE